MAQIQGTLRGKAGVRLLVARAADCYSYTVYIELSCARAGLPSHLLPTVVQHARLPVCAGTVPWRVSCPMNHLTMLPAPASPRPTTAASMPAAVAWRPAPPPRAWGPSCRRTA